MRNADASVRQAIVTIRFDQDASLEKCVDILFGYFTDASLISESGAALGEFYKLLRDDSVLSRALYDRLVDAHNAWAADADRAELTVVPACCCCGWDNAAAPSGPAPSVSAAGTGEVSILGGYIQKLVDRANAPGMLKNDKMPIVAPELFGLLTSPTVIDPSMRESLYAVLQRNEVLGAGLFEIAVSCARLSQVSLASIVQNSPVVNRLAKAFKDGGGGGGGGGGCCCCCCCCCCGGCCDCGGDC